MARADEQALKRLLGAPGGTAGVGVDELQGLLLQITLAIMVVFIIAFFIFRVKTEAQLKEEVLKLNRQKLVMAAEQVEADYRGRYGLTNLLPPVGGLAAFNAANIIRGKGLVDAPAITTAFANGAKAAHADYAHVPTLAKTWRTRILGKAGLEEGVLTEEDSKWLDDRLALGITSLRADVHGVQRACAAQLQRAWLEKPADSGDPELTALVRKLKGADDETRLLLATEISTALKTRSLARLAELAGSDLLP